MGEEEELEENYSKIKKFLHLFPSIKSPSNYKLFALIFSKYLDFLVESMEK